MIKRIANFAKQNKIEIVLFITIVFAAAILRFYNLEWEAFSWNEGTHLGGSKEYAAGNFFRNFNDFATPPLVKYFGAIVLLAVGFSEFWLRSIGVIFGLASLIVTYLLTRRYYDAKIALFSSMIVAFSVIHLAFTRTFHAEPILGTFFITAIYFYLRIVEDGKRGYYPLFLGIVLALAVLSKYIGLYLVFAIIIHALLTGRIQFRIHDRLSIDIERWILLSLVTFFVAFFLIWPAALYPVKIHADVSVVGEEDRGRNFTIGIPTIILSPQEYLTNTFGREEVAEIQPLAMNLPILGYVALLFTKENLVLLPLFIAGLLAIYRSRRSVDGLILMSLFVFIAFLWLQRYGQTYRYLTPIIPLAAIVAARSLDLVKKRHLQVLAAVSFGAIFLSTAVFAHPRYTLHYNPLENVFGFKQYDIEITMVDGYRQVVEFALTNCAKVYGSLSGLIINYAPNHAEMIVKTPNTADLPLCILSNSNIAQEAVSTVESLGSVCRLAREIGFDGLSLHSLYTCI